MKKTASAPAPTNRLAGEQSPYLLQHQHNPVDWFPWGQEAFDKARQENKPVFVSIGYSTCHWCHVMERESFEHTAVADYLNRHFVSIKVDREERPDLDKIYMTFVQAMTGQGGWPLSVFVSEDRKPFYGGTYWPVESKYGRPGFLQVLEQILKAWENRRDQLEHSAVQFQQQLQAHFQQQPSPVLLDSASLHQAAARLKEGYDPDHGGWGSAPKFPSPSHPSFLLQYGARFHDQEAVDMVLHTCSSMAAGGICDQLGGGFARYSVDAAWLVPHFEKMLYDNAQLLNLYLNAALVSGQSKFARVAHDILRYVLRDMTHPKGGFFSAEDADSEGKEGKFYCWTLEELERLLTPEELALATTYFGVTRAGNFLDHSDPDPLPELNVLSLAQPKLKPEDEPLLETIRHKLFEARANRVRPQRDDKVLASWNGLMLQAISRAGAIFNHDAYRQAAQRNFEFLRSALWDPRGRVLYHRWRNDQRDSVQLLEAYAFLLAGTLELYQATLQADTLAFAVDLAQSMIDRFYDSDLGGFWQTPPETADVILRVKDDSDGAEPSGNSVAVLALFRLSAITARPDFQQAADKSLRFFSQKLQQFPQTLPGLLSALDFVLQPPTRVVIAGADSSSATRLLLQAAHRIYQPNRVILGTTGPVEEIARALESQSGRPTAYVCVGASCRPPVTEPEELERLLQQAT